MRQRRESAKTPAVSNAYRAAACRDPGRPNVPASTRGHPPASTRGHPPSQMLIVPQHAGKSGCPGFTRLHGFILNSSCAAACEKRWVSPKSRNLAGISWPARLTVVPVASPRGALSGAPCRNVNASVLRGATLRVRFVIVQPVMPWQSRKAGSRVEREVRQRPGLVEEPGLGKAGRQSGPRDVAFRDQQTGVGLVAVEIECDPYQGHGSRGHRCHRQPQREYDEAGSTHEPGLAPGYHSSSTRVKRACH